MTTEQQLDQAIERLARGIEPPHDLWARIEPALQGRPARTAWYQHVNARRWAAVFVLALTGVAWWSQMDLPQPMQTMPGTPVAGVGPDDAAEVLPAEALIMASFEQIKAGQLSELQYVSPDAGDWRYQLTVWDQAISQVSGALEYHPDDPFLLAQMQGLYQQQLDYLHTISALETNYVGMGNE